MSTISLNTSVSLGAPKVNESFAETVAAFANGNGGVVLIGVDDDARVVGYDQPKARDQIVDIVRTYVADPVAVGAEKAVMPNRKPIWVVTVPRQTPSAKPFRCSGRVMIRAKQHHPSRDHRRTQIDRC